MCGVDLRREARGSDRERRLTALQFRARHLTRGGAPEVMLSVLIAALMLVPCVVAIAVLAGRQWWPVDDFAVIDLRVRDAWSLHPPLTGLYSRPGWNHPGPLMFWLMSPVSLLSHAAPWGTRIGGALLQGIALGWLGWLS